MKLTYEGEHGLKFESTNPDESLKKYWINRGVEALWGEVRGFFEEVSVEFRKLEPGQTKVLESKPIKVTISKEIDIQNNP